MPGIPLVARETTYSVSNCSYTRMCKQDSHARLSAEEEAAEESLSIYCKPVSLYDIIQHRATRNPSFLQRCLRYKIQEKRRKRIHMTISLKSIVNDELQLSTLFPLCIILARPVHRLAVNKDCAVYQFSRVCFLTACKGVNMVNRQAKFVLPEISNLSKELKCGHLSILIISCAELIKDQIDLASFPSNVSGHCFLGRFPMELLLSSLEKSPNLSLLERGEMVSMVYMHSCLMMPSLSEENKHVSFQFPHVSGAGATLQQLQLIITAKEIETKERSSYEDVPIYFLPQTKRLRAGNVVFNYKYYQNDMQKTEVTEDFTCPFCLVRCACFKGLRLHLTASHDLFDFNFWVTSGCLFVNVMNRRYSPEDFGRDLKYGAVYYCYKPLRRQTFNILAPATTYGHPLVLDFPASMTTLLEKTNGGTESVEREASGTNIIGVASASAPSFADRECVGPFPGSRLKSTRMLKFAKTRKLSARPDPRKEWLDVNYFSSLFHSRVLLQKRQFFHSQRAQPMALEQVFSDQDSEDEIDDDVADLEDKRMIDDFVDVTKDEKKMMHLWNSFVRKQRVLVDGHIPWACEAFTRLHGEEFVCAPALLLNWRLFMIKLWNHGLLDPRTMNSCNVLLEKYQNQGGGGGGDPKKS